jgi:polar amino acid transport system substrate-binding protein
MKKHIAALLLVLMCSGPAFAKTYLNGIHPNFPPLAYIDEKSGQAAGFDVEAMDWIANSMGFHVTHAPIDWEDIIPALLAKKIDMICSGMSITPERERQVAFSAPYWKLHAVFVVRQDSDLSVPAILTEKSRIGGLRGASEAEALVKDQKAKELRFDMRLYDSAPLLIENLIKGSIVAALMDSLPAQDAIAKGRLVKIAGIHGKPVHFGVALRKEDAELMQLVNEGYTKLLADPFWKQLQQKYNVQP